MADFSQKQVRNRYFSEYGSGGPRGSREIEERFFERLKWHKWHIFDFLLDRLNIVFNANPVADGYELWNIGPTKFCDGYGSNLGFSG